MRNIQSVSAAPTFPPDTSWHTRRLELTELSKQLRKAHSQILETSNLLKQESEELSKESRLLRNNGHRLRKALDAESVRQSR